MHHYSCETRAARREDMAVIVGVIILLAVIAFIAGQLASAQAQPATVAAEQGKGDAGFGASVAGSGQESVSVDRSGRSLDTAKKTSSSAPSNTAGL